VHLDNGICLHYGKYWVIIAITARGEDGSERGGLLENGWEIKIQFHE
jgi:hypothetical protein